MDYTEEEYSDEYYNYNESYSLDDYHTICIKEDIRNFGKVFLPIFYALALIIGLAGNALVVAIYTYYKKLKTKTDVYILNLAIADILLLLTLPFWAADAVHGWELGEVTCKITSALYVTNFSCGMLFLACISIDRYQAIIEARTGKGKSLIICLIVWVAAVLLSLPELIFTTVGEPQGGTRKICHPVYPTNMARPAKATIQILEILFSFGIPFIVMLFCYTKVSHALIRTPNVKKWRAFKVLLAVVGVFILTQLPYNIVKLCRSVDLIYSFLSDCETSKRFDMANQITESIALFHSCLNPIMYTFVGVSIKNHILKFLKSFSNRQRRNWENVTEISLNSHSNSENTCTFSI